MLQCWAGVNGVRVRVVMVNVVPMARKMQPINFLSRKACFRMFSGSLKFAFRVSQLERVVTLAGTFSEAIAHDRAAKTPTATHY